MEIILDNSVNMEDRLQVLELKPKIDNLIVVYGLLGLGQLTNDTFQKLVNEPLITDQRFPLALVNTEILDISDKYLKLRKDVEQKKANMPSRLLNYNHHDLISGLGRAVHSIQNSEPIKSKRIEPTKIVLKKTAVYYGSSVIK